jgi:tetratricopeptide (TPR) repeat protein
MSSIIEGYAYDIFISYRLRDNKGEKWVSEFVEALRTELESTFKEDISIYFDENPHDGLLETDDVGASLREKLKCLIFIPVISRIYCDPKAYAWEHEFRAFVETASTDRFGLRVTLPNGNVSTRVLPVRIHELDREDIKLCESLLGSVLRGVDFIYKSPGVNRPLRANEDHPQDNINKTYYRDQINKVANAISDILTGLKRNKTETGKRATGEQQTGDRKKAIMGAGFKKVFQWQKLKKRGIFLLSLLVILSAVYLIFRKINQHNNEKSIALIGLQNMAGDTTLTEAANEFNLVLNQKLSTIKGFTMPSGYRTEKYLENEQSINNIRNALKVNYILTGSIIRNKKEVTILFQLSETRDFKVLWSSPVVWNSNMVSKNSNEIIRSILSIIGVRITPEEDKQLDIELSGNHDDNLKILAANKKLNDAWEYFNYDEKVPDSRGFKAAIEAYDNIIKEDTAFALAYAKRAIALSFDFFLGHDSSDIERCKTDVERATSLNKNLPEADNARGFYYYYCLEQNEKALDCFAKAAEKDPGNYKPLFYIALTYRRLGRWNDCLRMIDKVIRMNPQEPLFLTNIGMVYMYMHKFDSAILFQNKAIDLMPGWAAGYKNKFESLILKDGVSSATRNLIDEAIERTGDKMTEYRIRLKIYEKSYQDAFVVASRSDAGDFEIPGTKYIYLAMLSSALKNPDNALKYYDSAKLVISRVLQKRPNDYQLHGLLGVAYAGLMDKRNAVDEAEEAIELAYTKNRMDESDLHLNLARIHTMLGNYEDACSRLAFLLNNPSDFSKKMLLLNPVWKPLTDQAEYLKKLRNYYNN